LKRHAIFDDNRFYRYSLSRMWDDTKEKMVYIMINPSVGDERVEDRTLDRCIQFARDFGYGSLEVVNLFAMITTKPDVLKTVTKEVAIGPKNQYYIDRALSSASLIVAAWGTNIIIHKRHRDVFDMFSEYTLHRLGPATKDGHPPHPLYLKKETQLTEHLPTRYATQNRLNVAIKDAYTTRKQKNIL